MSFYIRQYVVFLILCLSFESLDLFNTTLGSWKLALLGVLFQSLFLSLSSLISFVVVFFCVLLTGNVLILKVTDMILSLVDIFAVLMPLPIMFFFANSLGFVTFTSQHTFVWIVIAFCAASVLNTDMLVRLVVDVCTCNYVVRGQDD